MINLQSSRLHTIVIVVVMLLALGFQLVAIHEQSLSGDGAYHLIAGYQGWRVGQNRLNLEHPPLVKTIMTFPLLFDEPLLTEPVPVKNILAAIDNIHANALLIRRATIRARYMALIFFVIPFLAGCYYLGRYIAHWPTGIILLCLVAFSFSVIPTLTILQTDTAVSLGYLLTLLALFRLLKTKSYDSAVVVGIAFGFAVSVKFSGLLLLPTILIAVILIKPPARSYWFSVRRLSLIILSAWIVLELSYWAINWNYTQEVGRMTIRTYTHGQAMVVRDQMQGFEPLLLAVESKDPFLAQWITGMLGVYTQNSIGVYPVYAFGEVSYWGRYGYFPALFLIRVPLVILLTGLFAVFYFLKRGKFTGQPPRQKSAEILLLLVTVGAYLWVAVTSNYNLGFRHLIPIIPIVYLPAACWLAQHRAVARVFIGLLMIEALLLSPLWMNATNTWWLGEANPTRFVFSLEDNFIQLAKYGEQHNIKKLNVIDPGTGEKQIQAYIPDARLLKWETPLEAGWYAVSVRVEQFVPALLYTPEDSALKQVAQQWHPVWQTVKTGQDFGYAAGSFHIYYLDEGQLIKPGKAQSP
ncbi:MAG: glycosyltransferase family 39 protein [Anaerolineae bacterium]|nr:glycosyltransferase family 39 protein [Anaerolineae bacterium]